MLISGIEFRFGPYSLAATEPLTASMDGLRGVWINSRPDTVVEIHSPEIMPGDKFFLDGRMITAVKWG